MRLSTRVHGTFDLGIGVLLIVLPWFLGFGGSTAAWTAALVGVAVAANALLTDFELGRIRRIAIPVHLWIDGLLGVFLAVSPWLLQFDRTAWVPHVLVGVALAAAALLSETVPAYDRRRSLSAAAE
ncbi:MAG TPA: SPW repeat protein [Longimicrobiaceae bacterium]|nr:SPW repeat protein [Longimicrobiaceae bacterium]